MIHSVAGKFLGQRGLTGIQKKNPELQTMQVIKMVTHALIEKTAFSHPLLFTVLVSLNHPCILAMILALPCCIILLMCSLILLEKICSLYQHL
jgi:hypothetical protein